MTSTVVRIACLVTLLPGYAIAQTPVLATPAPLPAQAPDVPSETPMHPDQRPAMPRVAIPASESRVHELEGLLHDLYQRNSGPGSGEVAQLAAHLESLRAQMAQGDRVAVARAASTESTYNAGLAALQGRQYDRAIGHFNRVIDDKSARADAATYWKAFAQYKLARGNDASTTIAALRRDFPKSRYLGDASVLETEIKKMAGQTIDPADLDNDEIKLLAIQGLERSEQATPLLESVLAGPNSLPVKKRALYVLAVDMDERKQAVLLRYAKGAGTPDLQVEAIRYLAVRADRQALVPDLREIYRGTQDAAVKRAIIDLYRGSSFRMLRTENGSVVAVAGASRSSAPAAVATTGRAGARSSGSGRVQYVPSAEGGTAWRATAQQELWSLYQQETDSAIRAYIASALGTVGATPQLQQIISDESTDPAVRLQAIRSYSPPGDALVTLYAQQRDQDSRMAVIASLASQQNADALVALARKETNRDLKTAIVRRLSEMARTSKVAADYMAEVIK